MFLGTGKPIETSIDVHHHMKTTPEGSMNKTTIPSYFHRKPLYAGILGSLITIAPAAVLTAEISSNPCAAKRPLQIAAACNPCNPCAVKNACSPCNPRNPCAAKNACNPCNPCAAKNACSPCNPCNPCGGTKVSPCAVKRPAGTALMISKDPAVNRRRQAAVEWTIP